MNNNDVKYKLSLQDLFSSKMADAINQTKRMDSSMDSLGSKLKRLFIGVGVAGLAKSMIETGASFEMAEVQLKTLLKSTTEAKRVFDDLKKESVSSPFGFDTLLKGNAALISTGISAKQAKGDFNALANAIAATGGGEDALQRMVFNLQQIKNVGATATDIKQFGMAGINIYGLLDKYAQKYKVNIDKHHITYENIIGALKMAGAVGGDYYNALNNMSNTTSGRLSNLKDSFKNFQYELFNKLKPTIDIIVTGITNLMNFIVKHLDTIKNLTEGVLALYAAFKLYQGIMGAIALVQGVKFLAALVSMSAGLKGATVAQYALNTAMNLCPIVALISMFGLLIYTIKDYKTVAALNAEGVQKSINEGIASETKLVQDLAASYQKFGKTKADAQKLALLDSKKNLLLEITEMKAAMDGGGLSDYQKEVMNLKMASAEGRMKALTDGSIFYEGSTNSTLGGEGANVDSSIGSGTEVTSARPQNLNITINKLIETQNITTTNMKEGAVKIKEMVAQALLETVNDVNLITK